ncbi:MAG: phosphohydrolase [Bacteroidetes bacterium]|nr:MAG: phosphohydrolase [Bacteroidota bacterium]
MAQNKKKIFNDPVYGFINIPGGLIFDLIEHPYFQRLRRITQLGLSHLVYPSAIHSRFSHVLGAMFLMNEALQTLKQKGSIISDEEKEAALIAILLHDIGHGPFSHALEHSIVDKYSHEELSILFMERLNKEFDGKLSLAISIFKNEYPKHFLHQLVSGQLDVDRLDYLRRDSFFTGVSEGVIGTQRIIKMLDVDNDQLVVEAKGVYSIENFLNSRRIMYWQVYLHKTVLSAEYLMMNILKRAKELSGKGVKLFTSPALGYFLETPTEKQDFSINGNALDYFANLDDNDILTAIKVWMNHDDIVLSRLSTNLINRRLFKVEFSEKTFDKKFIEEAQKQIAKEYEIDFEEAAYFIIHEKTSNSAYKVNENNINIRFKDGTIKDVSEASDNMGVSGISNVITKYFLCRPK